MSNATDDSVSAYKTTTPKYHTNKDAAYILPNDDTEHVRLETQARHLAALMDNEPIRSPIPTSSTNLRVLDVGCGTGNVTNFMGSRYPDAQVYGLDLSPVPSLQDSRPNNVRFLQGNILRDKPSQWKADLPRDESLFDLVFSRLLVFGMDEWTKYVSQTYDLLRPHGYMEVQEVDFVWLDQSGNELSRTWDWWQTLKGAGEAVGLDWECGSKAQKWMQEAGFVDVRVERYRWPWGGEWEETEVLREFGEYVKSNLIGMFWLVIPTLLKGAGWNDGEEIVAKMRNDMIRDLMPEKGKHWWLYVTVGRKPEA